MRAITAVLWNNAGGGSSLSLDLTGKLAGVGALNWTIDEELTRVQAGTCSLKVWDEDGAIWAWLSSNLKTVDAGRSQLLPAFLEVYVAGTRRFLGILAPDQIRRDLKTRVVELQAQDWSVMLRDQALTGPQWQRRLPRVISTRTGSTYAGQALSVLYMYVPADDVIVFPALFASLQAGDLITTNKTGATQYKVTEVGQVSINIGSGMVYAKLAGWSSLAILGRPPLAPQATTGITVTRLSQSLAVEQGYFSVMQTYTPTPEAPVYTIRLDTVDWLVAGDELRTVSGTLMKVADVDTERREISLVEPLTGNLLNADKLYFTTDSLNQLVFEDAGMLMARAAMPYSVDLSRYAPGQLPRPVLAWLPWHNAALTGEDPRAISDLETTLTGVRLLSQSEGKAWSGTPEAGYTTAALAGRYVDWTSQISAAPAQLMPDTTPAIAPDSHQRNRTLQDWKWVNPVTVDGNWSPLYPPTNAPSANAYPAKVVTHDYNQLRRLTMDNGTGNLAEERWNGTAWSAATTAAWPVAGWHPCAMAPMVGIPATSGPVAPQGQALLAVATSAGSYELQLVWAGTAQRLAITSAQARGAVLRTTPWGVYLFGPGGFGKVSSSAGALSLAWVPVYDSTLCTLWPETLTALDAATLYILGAFQVTSEDGSTHRETWLLQLNPSPNPAAPDTAVSWREMIMPGAPRLAVARRDPSTTGRILGVLGGRLYQVSKTLPATIERVNASTMSGGELLEYVAQAQNALVAPRPDGVLEVISRNTPGASVPLTVDRAAVHQSQASQNFFSVVRVSGADDSLYADYPGPYDAAAVTYAGGRALEINSHPLVWTLSHCYALAAAYGAFLGVPRAQEEHTWFCEDALATPPWESLRKWERFTVNGAATNWLLLGLHEDLVRGEAKATLLEAP